MTAAELSGRRKGRVMIRVSLMASAGLATLLATGPCAAWAADTVQLDEIVVTANKREQSVYQVAGSVASIQARGLENQGLNTLMGLSEQVPGLSFFSRGATGANQVAMRGLTSGSQQTSPTVGFYVNDTPFGFSIPVGGGSSILQPDIDPADIDHIEVLRGPQGTLYGASTLGGLIKYVTRRPDPTALSGTVRVEGDTVDHGGAGYVARGQINVPFADGKAAARLSLVSREDPGFIDNPRTGGKDVNATRVSGARAALGFYPTDNLSLVVTGLVQQNRVGAAGSVVVDPVTLAPTKGDLTQDFAVNQYFNTEYRLADAELKWKFGRGYSLVSSSSYGQVDLNLLFDVSALLPPNFLGGAYYVSPQDLSYKKWTQEVRLASPSGDRIEWLAGVYYTREEVLAQSQVAGYTAAGAPGPLVPVISKSRTPANYDEVAAFANATYNITPDLAATVGVRYADIRVKDQIYTSGLLVGRPLDQPSVQNGRSTGDATTYLASLNWRFAKNGSLYVRAASGYRPGGPVEPPAILPPGMTLPTQFNPDQVWNYEIGGRGAWFENRLTADASVFYIDWSDIQLPFLVNGFRVLSNGGSARSQGVEFNTQLRPAKGLKFGLAGAYTDAQLTQAAPLVYGHSGDRLPFVAKWSLTGSVNYERPLNEAVTANVGALWHYESDRNTALSKSDPSFVALDGFSTIDLQLGFQWDRYTLNGYIRNLFDERAYVSGGIAGGKASLVPIQPMTVGVAMSASF
ncbi:hypothetical protein C5708_11330 [Caulobacter sp. CCUG 60055]|nr:hypothetical protein [Caulobacter sp. CCUG 60055]